MAKEMTKDELRNLLKGSTIIDVDFQTFYDTPILNQLTIVTKEGQLLLATVNSEASYEGSTNDWLEIVDVKTNNRLV